MNKTEIINNMSRKFNHVSFQLKKHSPEILIVGGVIGTVASAVMACKATTRLNVVLEESKNDIASVHDYIDDNGFTEKYTENDKKKDLTILYTQAAVKVVKLYAPSVALGTLSITAILASNNILRKRNVALAAAYTAIDKSFKEYRGRVVERFGKEVDHQLKYNIKAKEIEETVTDENGKEKQVKKTVDVIDSETMPSEYAKFFDEYCLGWDKDPEYNLMFLRKQQSFANDLLKSRGYVFLNEVYEMLGIQKTKAGQIVGWIYDEENPIGDNFIDFGIYDVNRERNRDFVNGYERSILLDFNVDGNILDLM